MEITPADKTLPIVEVAARIAYTAHLDQTRKDDASPYFIHPCMVAMMLRRHGFADAVVAAGFVHDVLEDTKVTREELEEQLGNEVVSIVLEVTEEKALPWEERKRAYIEKVVSGSEAAMAVSIADKIHNLESLMAAYDVSGPAIWELFNRGKEKKLWFEETMLKRVQEKWQHPLVEEYAALVERMRGLEG